MGEKPVGEGAGAGRGRSLETQQPALSPPRSYWLLHLGPAMSARGFSQIRVRGGGPPLFINACFWKHLELAG